MICETLCEVKNYIEGNLNVQVSFRPSVLGIVADVLLPDCTILHVILDPACMDNLDVFKIALETKIFEWWKEQLKKK